MKKRIGKPVFFVVAILIIAFALLSTLGISTRYGDNETTIIAGIDDIRWGIDIRGGVNVTFGAPDDYDTSTITQDDLNAAKSIIETDWSARTSTTTRYSQTLRRTTSSFVSRGRLTTPASTPRKQSRRSVRPPC